jgi:hypothetical protein
VKPYDEGVRRRTMTTNDNDERRVVRVREPDVEV